MEVRSGYQNHLTVAPLSSLFSILALFTEEIHLPSPPGTMNSSMHENLNSNELVPYEAPPSFNLNDPVSPSHPQTRRKSTSMHPDIVARASVDSTIAIIPAEAFKRLVRIYPKASAHIVQVILTRFQRVTFLTGHKYLGLTAEILKTEKLLNTRETYELPNMLRRGVLEKLKERYLARSNEEDAEDGLVITHAKPSGRRRSHIGGQQPLRNGSHSRESSGFMANIARRAAERAGESRSRRDAAPGDIISSVPLHIGSGSTPALDSRTSPRRSPPSPTRTHSNHSFHDVEGDENEFRDAVLDCMFKAIGLSAVDSALNPALNGSSSVPPSPRLVSYDSVRQKAVFAHSSPLSHALPAFGQHNFALLNESQSSAMDDEEQSVASSIASIQSELENDVEVVFFKGGTVLVEQEERTPGLYYVIDGFLETCLVLEEEKPEESTETTAGGVRQQVRTTETDSARKRQSLFLVKPGGLAGYLGSISGFPSFCEIRAKTDVLVGFLPRSSLERIMEKQPLVLLTMAKRLISLLSPLVLHIDFALEWIQVNAGQVIYHQNDPSDAIYIVLHGRVRTLTSNHEVVGEYGRGESVGELEVLTDQKRGSTLHAIRDTELARFPKTLFNTLALEHPRISMQVYKMIANRMKPPKSLTTAKGTVNLRTVAILPVRHGIPIMEFAKNLQRGIAVGVGVGCQLLNQERVLETLGRHAFNRMGRLKLAGWLGELEEKWDMVLYVADTSVNSPWTQTCISQVCQFSSELSVGGLYPISWTGE
jgi:lysophospholipid hydrolase